MVGHKGVGGHVIQRRNFCLSSIIHLRGSQGICTKELPEEVLPEECACGAAPSRRDRPPHAVQPEPGGAPLPGDVCRQTVEAAGCPISRSDVHIGEWQSQIPLSATQACITWTALQAPAPASVHGRHRVTHSEVRVIARAVAVVGPRHEEDELVGEGNCMHCQSASIANHLPAAVGARTACKAPVALNTRGSPRDLSEAQIYSPSWASAPSDSLRTLKEAGSEI